MAFTWGLTSLCFAAAFGFYVSAAVGLSHHFGGFAGMENTRPAGYPGTRWFVAICAACTAVIIYSTLQFIRACRAIHHESNG